MPTMPDRDREQRKVRPLPERLLHHVRKGMEVETLRGKGKVVDVVIGLGEWSDDEKRLMPPLLVVELDEPWDGETLVTTLLHKCKLPGHGAVFKKPVHDLWPDQAPDMPSRGLKPTTEPKVKISEMIREAAKKEVCQRCKKALTKKEQWACGKCKAEVKGFLGDSYYDPNGPLWWTQIMHRYPLVRIPPYHYT
jgi:hypothetical protein